MWTLHWIWKVKKGITFILAYYKCFCYFIYSAKMLACSTRIYSNIRSQYSIIWFHQHKGFVATDPCDQWSLVDLLIGPTWYSFHPNRAQDKRNFLDSFNRRCSSLDPIIQSWNPASRLIESFDYIHRALSFLKGSIQRTVSEPTRSP